MVVVSAPVLGSAVVALVDVSECFLCSSVVDISSAVGAVVVVCLFVISISVRVIVGIMVGIVNPAGAVLVSEAVDVFFRLEWVCVDVLFAVGSVDVAVVVINDVDVVGLVDGFTTMATAPGFKY